jgi:16S rRNA (cytosine1402-N4)-methyltransferase
VSGGDAGYHAPVMVAEVVKYLGPARGGLFFDGTLGGGGHTAAILDEGKGTRVIGVDRDMEALAEAKRNLASYGDRVTILASDFASAAESITEPLSGALLDLGVSSHQIDETRRGFSFRRGAPLDMRMSGEGATAADLLNELPQSDLADVFYRYGEERRSRRLAAEVVKRRRTQRFETSDDLVAALHVALGGNVSARTKARIFQSLRIATNQEMVQLERALPALRDRLAGEGVFVVLTYHSIEDREVKERFREWSRACTCPPELPVCVCGGVAAGELLTRKPVTASDAEVASNPRARSAKLRAWRKAA